MAFMQCSNGHYYDDAKYLQCPYCGIEFNTVPNNQYESGSEKPLINKEENEDETVLLTEDDDRTLLLTEEDDDRTLLLTEEELKYSESIRTESGKTGNVTGWLVCIEGIERGRAYTLYEGKSRIGRSAGMDICIKNDFLIMADSHCIIEYEKDRNLFILWPNPAAKTYVNNKPMEKKKKIGNGDRIRMGESVFEFVTFCHGRKKW